MRFTTYRRCYGLRLRVSSAKLASTIRRELGSPPFGVNKMMRSTPHVDPEVPLVYSLNYTQQGHQGWGDDELPRVGRMRKQELGRSNLHAEEDFSEKLESLNLDPRLTDPIKKYEHVFGALPPPLSCKKLVQMDLKLKREFEGSVVRLRTRSTRLNARSRNV